MSHYVGELGALYSYTEECYEISEEELNQLKLYYMTAKDYNFNTARDLELDSNLTRCFREHYGNDIDFENYDIMEEFLSILKKTLIVIQVKEYIFH